jgi:hypothetical protein
MVRVSGVRLGGRDAPEGRDVGDVAQLGERLPCTEKVTGSSPVVSTNQQSQGGPSPVAGSGFGAGTRSAAEVLLVLASSPERSTGRSGSVYLDNCIASVWRRDASRVDGPASRRDVRLKLSDLHG